MSVDVIRSRGLAPLWRKVRSVGYLFGRIVVGDRVGFAIFLSTLLFAALTWRVGFFITDNYTLANTLAALGEGHLTVEQAVYGDLETPGMQISDGRLYGRNYGQVALAVPLLWTLQAATRLVDFGLLFAALWSLVLLALAVQIGVLTGRRTVSVAVGAVLALAFFALNALFAEPLSQTLVAMAALQLGTVLATAWAGSTMYRLLSRIHDRRVGIAAGSMAIVATPVGFWAAIPKRHVTVVAIMVAILYTFYRSRGDEAPDSLLSPLGFRALSYALIGVLTWIHAGEGFVVFLALLLVDVPTARSNDGRTLLVVGAAFALSFVPFFLTNLLMSGDPVRPPRMLTQFGELTDDQTFSSGSGGGSSSGGASGFLPPVFGSLVAELSNRLSLIFGPFVRGARVSVTQPNDIYQTFVRAGYLENVGRLDNSQAINLTLLESAPILGGTIGLLGTATLVVRTHIYTSGMSMRDRFTEAFVDHRPTAERSTDAFVGLSSLFVFLVYIPRLPLHAQVTVRYLLPLYPLAVYGIFRMASVRRTITRHGRLTLWSYLGGVLFGSQLIFVAVSVGTVGRGGALQLHAVAGLVVGTAFALATLASSFDSRFDPVTAVSGGLSAALGTNLVLLSGLVYFQYGPYVLPMMDWLADVLAAA